MVMREHNYYVYMLTNQANRVLYTGVTNDLVRRVYQHKNFTIPGFTSKYKTTKLVWFEHTEDVNSAIDREKQIKAGSRAKKIQLIEQMNPEWTDLYSTL